jgi:ADP-ribosyl-[dinitrogen reductase] hydrolase
MTEQDRFRGCLLGLAVGDAVGTTLEFKPYGSFKPITDMVGGGPFRLKPGEWTDDTSMALCLATSLAETGVFNPKDQMDRYCRWRNDGYLSSNGRCFDIGNTVAAALNHYQETHDRFAGSTDPRSAGNGSIMRLAPVPMFYFPDREAAVQFSAESSRTTHGAPECVDACRFFGGVIFTALAGRSKEEILFSQADSFRGEPKIVAIARGEYRYKPDSEIRGTGYAVQSLEAALWCFFKTKTFEHAILKAANLGDDADTTAAICGQLAGAFYGASGIPEPWLNQLVMRQEISDLADRLYVGTAV